MWGKIISVQYFDEKKVKWQSVMDSCHGNMTEKTVCSCRARGVFNYICIYSYSIHKLNIHLLPFPTCIQLVPKTIRPSCSLHYMYVISFKVHFWWHELYSESSPFIWKRKVVLTVKTCNTVQSGCFCFFHIVHRPLQSCFKFNTTITLLSWHSTPSVCCQVSYQILEIPSMFLPRLVFRLSKHSSTIEFCVCLIHGIMFSLISIFYHQIWSVHNLSLFKMPSVWICCDHLIRYFCHAVHFTVEFFITFSKYAISITVGYEEARIRDQFSLQWIIMAILLIFIEIRKLEALCICTSDILTSFVCL